MKLNITSIFSVMTLVFSAPVFASQLCNASGADPLLCQTQDGQYAFEITANRNITGLGISTKSFCTKSYLKLDGKEINGAEGTEVGDDGAGLSYVEAVTSALGVRVANHATHKMIMPVTVIGYFLKTPFEGADSGNIFVYGSEQDLVSKTDIQLADLYMYDGDQLKGYKRLSCK